MYSDANIFSGALSEAANTKDVERAMIVGLEVRGDVVVITVGVGAISNWSIQLLWFFVWL